MPGPREQVELEGQQPAIEGEYTPPGGDGEEERRKALREKAENQVRLALGLPKDVPLTSDHHIDLANQYERQLKGESLTPKARRRTGVVEVEVVTSGSTFKIDPTGRLPDKK